MSPETMDHDTLAIDEIIEDLSRGEAYGLDPGASVEVRQTHISVVFLVGDDVYKVKKPVDLGFLDFATLERRRHFCDEEIRINRRLAPGVYEDVRPIGRGPDGRLRVDADGPVLEWAVHMRRLPDAATLLARLERGELDAGPLRRFATRLAAFHRDAARGPRIAHFGTWGVVERNAAENFAQSKGHVGETVSEAVFDRVAALTEAALETHRQRIQRRAERDVPCETHGDLHLDHVYAFPDREPPRDLIAIDGIEFNERFRFADPVADVAFVVMDLLFHGRRDLANAFADAWIEASGDAEARALLPFYVSYRAVVRAKVEGFALAEPEIPADERDAARRRARAHWLLALEALESPGRRPCIVLIGGLPGAGKTTLARGLVERAGLDLIRADVVRKELAGISPETSGRAGVDEGLYAPAHTQRTYAECLRRAEAIVLEGGRAIVDASFVDPTRRRRFLDAASALGVPGVLVVCTAPDEVACTRIAARRGDASDADVEIRRELARRWKSPVDRPDAPVVEVRNDRSPGEAVARAVAALDRLGLADGERPA